MRCQYCGELLHPLRLISDQEFCNSAHRKLYQQRFRRVLVQLACAEVGQPSHPTVEVAEFRGEESEPQQRFETTSPGPEACHCSAPSPSWSVQSAGVTVEAYLLDGEVERGTLPASFPVTEFLVEGPHGGQPQDAIVSTVSPVVQQIAKAELTYCPTIEAGLSVLVSPLVIECPEGSAESIKPTPASGYGFSPITLDCRIPEFLPTQHTSLPFAAAPMSIGPLEVDTCVAKRPHELPGMSWQPIAANVVLPLVAMRIADAQIRACDAPALENCDGKARPGTILFSPTMCYPVFRNSVRIKGWRLRITFAERGNRSKRPLAVQ